MKKIILLSTLALLATPVTAAFAVPFCDSPRFDLKDSQGNNIWSEEELAAEAEQRLRSHGIDANQTRFWNGCIQTFVDDGTGHQIMKFYDYDTLAEVH
jgi:hypothetical protein